MYLVYSYHNGLETDSLFFIGLQNYTPLELFVQLARRLGNSKVTSPKRVFITLY